MVALGEESIRDALYEEMKDELITMAKSKYASFFVQKLVKYGTKVQRDAVFKVRFLLLGFAFRIKKKTQIHYFIPFSGLGRPSI